jgi:hypothetical protein
VYPPRPLITSTYPPLASHRTLPPKASAADVLEGFRASVEHFVSLSFDTISSSGPNGAVIHYKPSPETARPVDAGSVYLCDWVGRPGRHHRRDAHAALWRPPRTSGSATRACCRATLGWRPQSSPRARRAWRWTHWRGRPCGPRGWTTATARGTGWEPSLEVGWGGAGGGGWSSQPCARAALPPPPPLPPLSPPLAHGALLPKPYASAPVPATLALLAVHEGPQGLANTQRGAYTGGLVEGMTITDGGLCWEGSTGVGGGGGGRGGGLLHVPAPTTPSPLPPPGLLLSPLTPPPPPPIP